MCEDVAFRYRLTFADGEDAGTVEYPDGTVQAGDEIIGDGNRRYRVTAVIPVARIAEFVDGALNGVLEVEPLLTANETDRLEGANGTTRSRP